MSYIWKKILITKGKRGIGALPSADKGGNVTIMVNDDFPRVRIKPELLDGSPLFECWFDHFVEAVQPSHRTDKMLLILDGYSSHTKNTKVVDKARNNNIVIVSLPSHCMLQPFDVSVFKSVNANYNRAV